jgi:DNA replication protein DnaC
MEQINNLDYYRRTGMKRKKSYLFYGRSGCGKTAFVMAMANLTNRKS